MLDLNHCSPKFLDRQNQMFKPIHGTCDSVYHSLHSSGLVRLFDTSVSSPHSKRKSCGIVEFLEYVTQSHCNELFFSILGKDFVYAEWKNSDVLVHHMQFIWFFNPDCFTYVEHGSKNYTACVKDLRYENKQVPCPAVPENGQKCLVFLLDLYLSKLPTIAFEKDILYTSGQSVANHLIVLQLSMIRFL